LYNFDFKKSDAFDLIQASKKIYDTQSDDSFQKYLSDNNPFENPDYRPIDLVPIHSYFTHNKSSKFLLREKA
jgi:hypothetical protein